MPRYTRNTAILFKIETTYGTDAAPSGAANALLVSNQNINPLVASNVGRDIIRPYFGASEQLVGTRYAEVSFDVELVGSGTAGTAPAWGALLRAAGFAETLTATTRVDYTLVSTGFESGTLYYYDDGLLKKLLGARAECSFKLNSGERPVMSFRFIGIDGGETAAANPSVTLTAFKTPQVVTDQNTADITLGCTHSPTGAPALAGGTAVPSMGLELQLGNALNFTALLGGESADITGREVTGKARLDLTAAQEVTKMGEVKLATLSSLGLLHGTVVGNKVLVFMPSVQFINPTKEELNGRRLIGFDLRGVPDPAGTGNDELRIVTSF